LVDDARGIELIAQELEVEIENQAGSKGVELLM